MRAYAVTATVHIQVEAGGTKAWNEGNTAYSCWYPGTDCKVIKMDVSANRGTIVPVGSGDGYELTIKVEAIAVQRIGGRVDQSTYVAINGLEIHAGMARLVVDECPEIPSLRNVSVALEKVKINENGIIKVYLPK